MISLVMIPGNDTTVIISLVEYIMDNLEAGNTITGILLDLSKSFDYLGHNLVLPNY